MSPKAKPAAKDTIYIDAEDEITAIIDKLRASSSKVVALVLPKRNSSLQSTVNLKLLKHTADQSKKNLVLITSEASVLAMAGSVGLHIAKTLQTKPAIPGAPPLKQEEAITVEDETPEIEDMPVDATMPIGLLAGHVATEETIELDNEVATDDAKPAAVDKKAKKKLKVPDFDRFRLLLFGGGALLILLIVGGIFAFVILPKARITIKTDSSAVNTDLTVVASNDAKTVDAKTLTLPAVQKQLKKTDNLKVPATGQRNDGTKAKGTMTVYNCTDTAVSIPAGTTFTNTGFSFAADVAATIPPSDFFSNGTCKKNNSQDVAVTATKAGGEANLSAGRDYTSNIGSSLTGKGSAMTGGTTKLTQVVSQVDVDTAKQKVTDKLTPIAILEIKNQFVADNAMELADTLTSGDAVVFSTPSVNDAAGDVTVTVTITFTETGVKKPDLRSVVEAEINKHIDASKQVIQDNGISKAVIQIVDKTQPKQVKFNIKTIASAGPQLDGDGIKKQIAGKKKGDTVRLIQSRPGIKDVTITYSPFWVFSTPKQTSHITVLFDQNNAK